LPAFWISDRLTKGPSEVPAAPIADFVVGETLDPRSQQAFREEGRMSDDADPPELPQTELDEADKKVPPPRSFFPKHAHRNALYATGTACGLSIVYDSDSPYMSQIFLNAALRSLATFLLALGLAAGLRRRGAQSPSQPATEARAGASS
jgi:hypothetical protein